METNQTVCRLEGITSVSALIKALSGGTARRKIVRVLVDETKRRTEFRRVSFLKSAASRFGFPIEYVTKDEIATIAEGHTHGGIIAEVTPSVFPGLDTLIPSKKGFAMLLEGAEDPYSLGHSIRALYSCGATELILPMRFPDGADTVLSRASAGTSELLPIYFCDPCEAVRKYKEAGYTIAAADIRDAQDLCSAELTFPILLVIGGEKRGISSQVSTLTDMNIKIPYERDFMGSLPTETAVSVFAYEMMRRTKL